MARYLLFTAAVLIFSITSSLNADDAVAAALDHYESQIGRARDVFDRAAKTATDAAVRQLIGIAERAEKNKNATEAARAYKEVLRFDPNHTQARAFFEKQGNLDQILTDLTREWSPAVLPTAPKWEARVFYEVMLGTYNDGKIPLVNLEVPNGQNIRNDHVVDTAHTAMPGGKIVEIVSYKSTAHFIAPEDGEYIIVARGDLVIDDQAFANNDTAQAVTVRLQAGLHNLSLADRYELPHAILQIGDKRTRQNIHVFNSLAEIKQFLETPINGVKPIEASRWNPVTARPVTVELPGAGPTGPRDGSKIP